MMKDLKEKLVFLAGERALKKVRENGLAPEDVKIIAGAAGGPKWLILGQLDRFLFGEWFQGRKTPLFLIGSSIGSWRFAAARRRSPFSTPGPTTKSILRTFAREPAPQFAGSS